MTGALGARGSAGGADVIGTVTHGVRGLEDAPLEDPPKPFERIETPRPALRFRVLLRGDSPNELRIVR
jgi:hypothetical protein